MCDDAENEQRREEKGKVTEKVPCIFFFGDSLTDNGNNNYLATLAKVNYWPYGIDYPDGPTGRYSNGRNAPDFIAELLGFEKAIPPFATARGPEICKGVNYASGGSGILDQTGRLQGGRIPLDRQVLNHGMTASRVAWMMRNASKAREHLGRCLYSVNMGSNDYINNYFLPQLYPTQARYSPAQFAAHLCAHYSRQLRALYSQGARRVVIYAVGQVGCIPQFMSTTKHKVRKHHHQNATSCVLLYNKDAELFNHRLVHLVDSLNRDHPDANFILINTTSITSSTTGQPPGISDHYYY
ncbi:GDSL esterase/lipase At5g45670-like [Andrographis paniculata]|uniref:GDSL esterase/lipase At5g45670-like n=1 Tax=Andrographis paniculata TaxID=175694 RepID=UPI0021E90F69|nr:GDSL esterase/lipase At5g45670-like [Andrographis paniculata]